MVDIVDRATRSRMMSGIRGKNTKPELIVRKYLHAAGFRYRLHAKDLPGKPDIVLPKYKTAIFIHGCFWHQHEGCKDAVMPKSNTDFWKLKLNGNIERDRKNIRDLEDLGWRCECVWECEANDQNLLDQLVALLRSLEPALDLIK